MTGNCKHATIKNGDDWGIVYGIVLHTLIALLIQSDYRIEGCLLGKGVVNVLFEYNLQHILDGDVNMIPSKGYLQTSVRYPKESLV